MPARPTIASLQAEIVELRKMLMAAPASPSAASSHWRERDIPCTAKVPCGQTFRTVKGRDWHVANVKH